MTTMLTQACDGHLSCKIYCSEKVHEYCVCWMCLDTLQYSTGLQRRNSEVGVVLISMMIFRITAGTFEKETRFSGLDAYLQVLGTLALSLSIGRGVVVFVFEETISPPMSSCRLRHYIREPRKPEHSRQSIRPRHIEERVTAKTLPAFVIHDVMRFLEGGSASREV